METKLKKLFDYQRFEKNPELEKLIAETESRSQSALSDDDLSLVSAAGEPYPDPKDDEDRDFSSPTLSRTKRPTDKRK